LGIKELLAAHEADPERWRHVLDVDLTAAAGLTALVLLTLVARASSALVYIRWGRPGAPTRGTPPTSRAITEWQDWPTPPSSTFGEHGVKVSVVSPGLASAAGLFSPAGQ
jgi:hypothetical protein